jgi:2-dehydro-3-deoxygluconokinase
MPESPEILALGEPLIEFVRLPQLDGGRPVYRQGFGGDTSNAIIAAARQGASTGYLTAVGGDPFGQELIGLWNRENVATSFVKVRDQDPTGVYFVQPHPSGRSFSYARRGSAASFYSPEDLPGKAIAAAKILHVSALSQAISPQMCAAVRRAAEIARKNNTLVSYDTNLRLNLWTLEDARTAINDLLPLADIVLPSDDEAEKLTGLKDPDAIADHFLQHGAHLVLLKRGAEGVLLATQQTHVTLPASLVEAVDSTGAGDSYAGAFLAYYLETGDPEIAAKRAAIVAAGTVSGFGAVDPIPYRDAVLSGQIATG